MPAPSAAGVIFFLLLGCQTARAADARVRPCTACLQAAAAHTTTAAAASRGSRQQRRLGGGAWRQQIIRSARSAGGALLARTSCVAAMAPQAAPGSSLSFAETFAWSLGSCGFGYGPFTAFLCGSASAAATSHRDEAPSRRKM